jgi:hypothetical protein
MLTDAANGDSTFVPAKKIGGNVDERRLRERVLSTGLSSDSDSANRCNSQT